MNIKLDDTTFKGTLAVPLTESGAYRMDLEADRIDLARYMEPATDAPEAEEADTVPVEIPSELIRPLKARGNLIGVTRLLRRCAPRRDRLIEAAPAEQLNK